MEKKLTRSKNNCVLCGVCGGLAEYTGIDATVLRVIWAAVVILGGSGVALYIIAVLLMPAAPDEFDNKSAFEE